MESNTAKLLRHRQSIGAAGGTDQGAAIDVCLLAADGARNDLEPADQA